MSFEENDFLFHQNCEACGSSDANGVYSDGHTYCFSCRHRSGSDRDNDLQRNSGSSVSFNPTGSHEALRKRRISKARAAQFNYRVDPDFEGGLAHLAVYHSTDGTPVAAKVRLPGKKFKWIGDSKQAGLYGQHLWSPGRKLVITEGELDCLSVSEAQNGKFACVSLKSGAAGGKRDCADQIDWLNRWEEIILMMDQDEPGRRAAEEIASLFEPGKCRVATLPLKDASEVLVAGNPGEIIQSIYNAQELRPDGIVQTSELWDTINKEEEQSNAPYPFSFLNEMLYGLRSSEVVTVVSGTGMGKSAFVKEILFSLLSRGFTIGGCFLEEPVKRSILSFMGLHSSKNLVLPDVREATSELEMKESFSATAGTGRLFLFDHFGSAEPERLFNQLRFMVKSCGCNVLCVDHISILISGISDGDERRMLDNVMTNLRTLCQELDVIFILVSHLKRPDKLGHEEGARTSMSQIRSSTAIGGLSDCVIGLERNQQSENNSNLTTVRVLKNRFSGVTGVGGYLTYDNNSGRMTECEGIEGGDEF